MSNIEHCCLCDAATGRAGACEDSMYVGDKGPFCEVCYGTILLAIDEATSAHAAEVERLTAEIDTLEAQKATYYYRANVAAKERDAAVARAELAEAIIYDESMDHKAHSFCDCPTCKFAAALAAAPDKPHYAALSPEPWGGPEE